MRGVHVGDDGQDDLRADGRGERMSEANVCVGVHIRKESAVVRRAHV